MDRITSDPRCHRRFSQNQPRNVGLGPEWLTRLPERVDGVAEGQPRLLVLGVFGGHLRSRCFFSAAGLCTASFPLLSLRTRYCGSSSEARTFRLAAVLSVVIFSSTVPSAVLPWLRQVTLSPLLNSCVLTRV
jgi:hypothetical protein